MKAFVALFVMLSAVAAQAKTAVANPLELKRYGVIRCSDARGNLTIEIVKMSVNEWSVTQRIDGTNSSMTYHRDDVKIKILKAVRLYSSTVANRVTEEETQTDIAIQAEIKLKDLAPITTSLICEKADFQEIGGEGAE